MGFRDPGMNLIRGHAGLYVGREPDNADPVWASTTAVREPLERVDRSWRGIVMDTYALEKLTGWTPELSPPPDSPLYRWRVLAAGYAFPFVCFDNGGELPLPLWERDEDDNRVHIRSEWFISFADARLQSRLHIGSNLCALLSRSDEHSFSHIEVDCQGLVNVCFCAHYGLTADVALMFRLFCANKRLMQRSKLHRYSITSSALACKGKAQRCRASGPCGTNRAAVRKTAARSLSLGSL